MMTPYELIKSFAWERPVSKPPNRKVKPLKISFKSLWALLPVILRLQRENRKLRRKGRKPLFDLVISSFPVKPDKGVPLGGLGGGTITRGSAGDFNRWGLKPGDYSYRRVAADQFSVWASREGTEPGAVVLNPGRPARDTLQSWGWGLAAEKVIYRALFPRAWHDYDEPLPGIQLSCRQISPVIPHNYRESSFPVSTFVWQIENTGTTDAEVAILFTFQNGMGDKNDHAGGHSNHLLREKTDLGEVVGVQLKHIFRHPIPLEEGQKLCEQKQYEDQLTLGIGALATNEVYVSYQTRFVTNSNGADIWNGFSDRGCLANEVNEQLSLRGEVIGAAVSARTRVPAGESRQVVFALVWDMPIARFPLGTGWYRRYTKFYGHLGEAAPALLKDALTQFTKWEQMIDAWQLPILTDGTLPIWYRQMLFNETYYLVDGGTLWTAGQEDDGHPNQDTLPEPEIGHFGYLESHEYRMVNTYDVHFYASFALAMLWPQLELSLQVDFAHSLGIEDSEPLTFLYSGEKGIRKTKNIIPHDLGSPLEDPWLKMNTYNAQDASRWKDLNPKFVLQIARNYFLTGDKKFLSSVWSAVVQAIDAMFRFDKDGDGMIENEGFPDQTYDIWSVKGVSAYTGGLWLACLQAGAALAKVMGNTNLALDYLDKFEKAQQVYERKLWNGEYYQYEASSKAQDSIMADQLAGHWYSRACRLGGVVPEDNARSALSTIFRLNVMGYENGRYGAMNGMRPDGTLDRTGMQSMEIWTGTTFAIAAAMLQAGLREEAFQTAQGIFNMVYEDYGLWFQTPEALSALENTRAISYMRPLAIWAMQWELENRLVNRGGRFFLET